MTTTTASMTFYRDLKPFTRFEEASNSRHYVEAPSDWVVVVTDVKGSTKAISENRYKDVNMVGAASITALLNYLRSIGVTEIPYVFGGDGATFLLHQSYLEGAKRVLSGSSSRTQTAYGLELRVGAVPVEDIRANGGTIEVAKYRVSNEASLAMLRGGGVSLAEKLIKADNSPYAIAPEENASVDLTGLSCRWNPIAAKRGNMVSLLVVARGSGSKADKIYEKVIERIEQILEHPESAPVTESKLDPTYNSANMNREMAIRAQGSFWSRMKYLIRMSVGTRLLFLLYKLRWKTPTFDSAAYVESLVLSTDFRKFDDTLRTIRDCSNEELRLLKQFLESEFEAERVFYGLHTANQALMTCLVFTTSDHVHFIDGADGGYAIAAKQLKEQMKNFSTL